MKKNRAKDGRELWLIEVGWIGDPHPECPALPKKGWRKLAETEREIAKL
jgi:hypothetical protein